jgi:hypothetical protein
MQEAMSPIPAKRADSPTVFRLFALQPCPPPSLPPLRKGRNVPDPLPCAIARGRARVGAQAQPYRFSGGMIPTTLENWACATTSTGLYLILVLAGSLPRKLSPFQFLDGLTGLGTNPPPQFGQTFPKMLSTHVAQNVHSYVQMRASSESGGNALLQFSQVGLSSSMVDTRCGKRERPNRLPPPLSPCGRGMG